MRGHKFYYGVWNMYCPLLMLSENDYHFHKLTPHYRFDIFFRLFSTKNCRTLLNDKLSEYSPLIENSHMIQYTKHKGEIQSRIFQINPNKLYKIQQTNKYLFILRTYIYCVKHKSQNQKPKPKAKAQSQSSKLKAKAQLSTLNSQLSTQLNSQLSTLNSTAILNYNSTLVKPFTLHSI